jgi:MoxR-like ATPase
MLGVINERVFHNGGAPVQCPLVSLFGASNELPEGRETEALFDRFILRFDVQYLLVASNLRVVLSAGEPAIATKLTMNDLRRAQAEAASVKITNDTMDALLSIRDACRGEGIIASDRRWNRNADLLVKRIRNATAKFEAAAPRIVDEARKHGIKLKELEFHLVQDEKTNKFVACDEKHRLAVPVE